ncbi:MAG: CRISPR-associated helicase Cas3' [candidate division WOR-3 bacterium]
MESSLPSSGLLSHPGIPLEQHLILTAELAELFLGEKPQPLRQWLAPVVMINALVHDLGKATSFFQEYLRQDGTSRVPSRRSQHGLFSALCAYYLVSEIATEREAIFSFIAVRRHHGDLRDIADELLFDDEDRELLTCQLEAIPEPNFQLLVRHLQNGGLKAELSREQIRSWIDDFGGRMRGAWRRLRQDSADVNNYIKLNLIYSLLIDADKSAAVVKYPQVFHRNRVRLENIIEGYRRSVTFPSSPMNQLRESAYQEVINFKPEMGASVYSLNLPTGLGKTLAAVAFALRLRQQVQEQTGNPPRIIYALPYLSIIEQNANVLETVLEKNGITPASDILLKHHHLSDIYYRKGGGEREYDVDESQMLIEGWNSELVITTFVQLFHTLFTNRNRALKKFHRLINSVIILDEVQAIPVRYWRLIRHLLERLVAEYHVNIIFVTATEPLIFARQEVRSLINDKARYFKVLDRVRLHFDISRIQTIEELADRLIFEPDRSYLLIMNTISAARKLYAQLQTMGVAGCQYLSTHLTPKDRLQRIRKLAEQNRAGRPQIAVTTQLVEAGVDIDFDVVVRDLAPLDSINQTAGRCNRNAARQGDVYIVRLADEKQRQYCTYIYDPVLLNITEQLIGSCEQIAEKDFDDLIDRYYLEVQSRKSQYESAALLNAVAALKYDSTDEAPAVDNFQLIEEEPYKFDVFIEQDEEAEQVWECYQRLKETKDPYERYRRFLEIKSLFYQYVISVPRNIPNLPEMVGELGYVRRSQLRNYYHPDTGFIIKDERGTLIV